MRKPVLTILTVIACFLVGYSILGIWRTARASADRSCLNSIAGAVEKAFESRLVSSVPGPRELTEGEIARIINNSGDLDCIEKEHILATVRVTIGEAERTGEVPVKVWTKPFRMLLRSAEEQVVTFNLQGK